MNVSDASFIDLAGNLTDTTVKRSVNIYLHVLSLYLMDISPRRELFFGAMLLRVIERSDFDKKADCITILAMVVAYIARVCVYDVSG